MLDLNTYFRYISSSNNDLIKDIKQHLEGGVKANRLRKDSGLICDCTPAKVIEPSKY